MWPLPGGLPGALGPPSEAPEVPEPKEFPLNASDFGADIFDGEGEADAPPPSKEKKKAKRTRSKRTAKAADEDPAAEAGPGDDAPAPAEPEAPAAPEAPEAQEAAAEAEAPAKKRRRKRTTKPKKKKDADEPEPGTRTASPAVDEEPAAEGRDTSEDRPGLRDPWSRDREVEEDRPPDEDRGVDVEREPGAEEEAPEQEEEEGRSSSRRRRRRRRRGGRSAEAQLPEEEQDRGPSPPPRAERRHRTGRMIPVPTPEGEIRGARVAVLLHLDPLIDEARKSGGEVAWGKLLQQVSRRRHLIRAIAYAAPETAAAVGPTLRGSGIETHAVRNDGDRLVAVAVDAMSLATRVDSVVLIPDSDGLGPLVAALRAHGIRVETAGFTETAGPDDDIVQTRHSLGAESLFVP